MNCQNLFSGETKKNISKCRLLKFLSSMLSVKCSCTETLNIPRCRIMSEEDYIQCCF